MKPLVNVILDTKSLDSEDMDSIERTSKDEKKALKWLKENAPIEIQVKYEIPFWSIDEIK